MGCNYNVTCADCGITYNCGYGSYGTWVSGDSVDEFVDDLRRKDDRFTQYYKVKLWKNTNVLIALALHHRHNVSCWGGDWAWIDKNDDLVIEGGYSGPALLVKGAGKFVQVDMEEE